MRSSVNLATHSPFSDCLRRSPDGEVETRATVVRGRLNDTLIPDLDGVKRGFAFDLFTGRCPFLFEETPDSNFKRSFGWTWYPWDVQIGHDDGHVRIKTILLDKILGFDVEVGLPPAKTFHVGFWFNNPQDVAAYDFPASSREGYFENGA